MSLTILSAISMISIVCWDVNDFRSDRGLVERLVPDRNKSDSSLVDVDSDLLTSSGIEKTKEFVGIYVREDGLKVVELESFMVLCAEFVSIGSF